MKNAIENVKTFHEKNFQSDTNKVEVRTGVNCQIIKRPIENVGLYIPAGFAHAYFSFDNENIIYYKLDNYYAPNFESGIIYNDSSLKIKWPRKKIIVSNKDRKLLKANFFLVSLS